MGLRNALVLMLASSAWVLASCGKNPARPVSGTAGQRDTLPKYFPVDYPISWSKDGEFAAFRRLVASSYGSPGLYVIDRWGRRPQYVLPGGIFWPEDVTFSPDGTQLAGIWAFALFVADLRTGEVRWPYYTANGVADVDWSPDGNTLVLSRAWWLEDSPEDSLGIHLFDLTTGQDRPFLHRGRHVYGRDPRWSPDGTAFALIEFAEGRRVAIYGLRDSSLRVAVPSTQDEIRILQWVSPAVFGRLQLAFRRVTGPDFGSYLVDPDGSHLRRLPYNVQWSFFSPTRPELLTWGWSGPDSLGVVWVDWVTKDGIAWGRRLTRWLPPP